MELGSYLVQNLITFSYYIAITGRISMCWGSSGEDIKYKKCIQFPNIFQIYK